MNENNANFTPDRPNFKTLVRMSFQGLTNFPYIEEDFDALTNYGFLSKVVEHLNDVISNNNEQNTLMTGLYDAYVSLQDYVNDYFDNLDVQDEINNKLDEMAEDGSLYELIRRFTDPIIAEQNERISNISLALSRVASGSPAGVYATVSALTSADPDHSRIYIVNEDGHWYYYNGSQWTDGGLYQSTVDTDEVALVKRNNAAELKNLYRQVNFNKNMFDGEYSHQFYSATTGQPTSMNNAFTSNVNLIDLTDVSSFYYSIEQNELNNITMIYFLFYSDEEFLGYQNKGRNNLTGNITPPTGSTKLRFEINYTNDIDIADTTSIIINTTHEEDVRTKFNNLVTYTTLLNEINAAQKYKGEQVEITLEEKCKNISGQLVDLTNLGLLSYHAVVNVQQFETYNIIASGSQYYPPFMFYDINDNLIATYYSISGDRTDGNIWINYTVQVPQNAVKMFINTFDNYAVLNSVSIKNVGLNVLPEQNYIAFGDSICRGNRPNATKTAYPWPQMFGEIHNLNTTNKANGGQGYLSTVHYNKTALQTIQETDISDANLITLSFGINDASNSSISIGEITDTGTTTVCGMVYNCINYILTTNPKCQIIVTGTTKQNGGYGSRLKEINEKLELICQKYGIAFINMKDQPINQWNGTTGGALSSDGTHFNDDGYLLLSQYMTAKLNTFYGLE